MEIFDILIIGGGPSALYEAAVLSKTDLNVAIISESFGGCMEMLGDQRLQSYIDELEILDAERRLANYIKNSTALNPTGQEYSSYIRDCIFDLKIKHIYGKVTHITKSESYFKIQQYKKKVLFARKVILATGIISKKTELALRSRYWISCFEVYNHIYSNQLERYVNQEICIVGGGNTAFQLASILSKKAKNITLLVKRFGFISAGNR
jgi:thioredoxin reductase